MAGAMRDSGDYVSSPLGRSPRDPTHLRDSTLFESEKVAERLSMSAEIDDLRKENESLKSEKEILRKELEHARGLPDSSSDSIIDRSRSGSPAPTAQALERELFECRSESLVLEARLRQQAEKSNELQEALSEAEQRNVALSSRAEAAEKHKQALEEAEGEIFKLRREIRSSEKMVAHLEDAKSQLEAELEEEVTSSAQKDSQLEAAWGDMEKLREQLADQASQTADLQLMLEGRSMGMMASCDFRGTPQENGQASVSPAEPTPMDTPEIVLRPGASEEATQARETVAAVRYLRRAAHATSGSSGSGAQEDDADAPEMASPAGALCHTAMNLAELLGITGSVDLTPETTPPPDFEQSNAATAAAEEEEEEEPPSAHRHDGAELASLATPPLMDGQSPSFLPHDGTPAPTPRRLPHAACSAPVPPSAVAAATPGARSDHTDMFDATPARIRTDESLVAEDLWSLSNPASPSVQRNGSNRARRAVSEGSSPAKPKDRRPTAAAAAAQAVLQRLSGAPVNLGPDFALAPGSSLESRLTWAAQRIAMLQSDLAGAEAELKEASDRNYEVAVKHRTNLARLEDSLAENERLRHTVQEQAMLLGAANQERKGLARDVQEHRRLKDMEEEGLRQQLEALKERLGLERTRTKQDHAQAQHNFKILHMKLKKERGLVAHLQEERHTILATAQQLQEEKQTAANRLQNLEEEKETALARAQQLQEENQAILARVQHLEVENRTALERVQKVQEENDKGFARVQQAKSAETEVIALRHKMSEMDEKALRAEVDMAEQWSEAKAAEETLKEDNCKMQEAAEALQRRLQLMLGDNRALQEQLEEMGELRRALVSSQILVVALRDQAEQSEQAIGSLKGELAAAEDAMGAAAVELDGLRGMVEHAEARAQAAEERTAAVEAKSRDDMAGYFKALEERIQDLEKTSDSRLEDLDAAREACRKAEAERDAAAEAAAADVKEQMDAICSARDMAESEAEAAAARADVAQQHKAQLEAELERALREYERLKEDLAMIEEGRRQEQARAGELLEMQTLFEDVTRRHAELEALREEASAKNAELREAAAEEMRSAAASWAAERADLEAQAAASQSHCESLTAELHATLQRMMEEAARADVEVAGAEQEGAALRGRCEEAERRASALLSREAEAVAAAQRAEAQLEAQAQELAASRGIRQDLHELSGQVMELQGTLAETMGRLVSSEEAASSAQAAREDLLRELSNALEEATELKLALERRTEQEAEEGRQEGGGGAGRSAAEERCAVMQKEIEVLQLRCEETAEELQLVAIGRDAAVEAAQRAEAQAAQSEAEATGMLESLVGQLQGRLAGLEGELQLQTAARAEAEERIRGMEASADGNSAAIQAEVQLLRSQVSELAAAAETAKAGQDAAEAERNDLREQAAEMHNQALARDEDLQRALAMALRSESGLQEASEDLRAQRHKVRELEEEKEALRLQRDTAAAELACIGKSALHQQQRQLEAPGSLMPLSNGGGSSASGMAATPPDFLGPSIFTPAGGASSAVLGEADGVATRLVFSSGAALMPGVQNGGGAAAEGVRAPADGEEGLWDRLEEALAAADCLQEEISARSEALAAEKQRADTAEAYAAGMSTCCSGLEAKVDALARARDRLAAQLQEVAADAESIRQEAAKQQAQVELASLTATAVQGALEQLLSARADEEQGAAAAGAVAELEAQAQAEGLESLRTERGRLQAELEDAKACCGSLRSEVKALMRQMEAAAQDQASSLAREQRLKQDVGSLAQELEGRDQAILELQTARNELASALAAHVEEHEAAVAIAERGPVEGTQGAAPGGSSPPQNPLSIPSRTLSGGTAEQHLCLRNEQLTDALMQATEAIEALADKEGAPPASGGPPPGSSPRAAPEPEAAPSDSQAFESGVLERLRAQVDRFTGIEYAPSAETPRSKEAERLGTLRRAAGRLEELRGENDNLWLSLREQTGAASMLALRAEHDSCRLLALEEAQASLSTELEEARRAASSAREGRRGAEAALERVREGLRQLRAEKGALEGRLQQREQELQEERGRGRPPRGATKPPLSPGSAPVHAQKGNGSKLPVEDPFAALAAAAEEAELSQTQEEREALLDLCGHIASAALRSSEDLEAQPPTEAEVSRRKEADRRRKEALWGVDSLLSGPLAGILEARGLLRPLAHLVHQLSGEILREEAERGCRGRQQQEERGAEATEATAATEAERQLDASDEALVPAASLQEASRAAEHQQSRAQKYKAMCKRLQEDILRLEEERRGSELRLKTKDDEGRHLSKALQKVVKKYQEALQQIALLQMSSGAAAEAQRLFAIEAPQQQWQQPEGLNGSREEGATQVHADASGSLRMPLPTRAPGLHVHAVPEGAKSSSRGGRSAASAEHISSSAAAAARGSGTGGEGAASGPRGFLSGALERSVAEQMAFLESDGDSQSLSLGASPPASAATPSSVAPAATRPRRRAAGVKLNKAAPLASASASGGSAAAGGPRRSRAAPRTRSPLSVVANPPNHKAPVAASAGPRGSSAHTAAPGSRGAATSGAIRKKSSPARQRSKVPAPRRPST